MATDLTRRLGRGAGLVGAFGGMLLAVFVAADRPRPASAQDKDDKGKGEYAGKGQKPPAGKPEWVGASVCQSCHRNEKPQDDPLLKQTLGYEFVRMWENKVWAVHDLHSTAYKNLTTAATKDTTGGEVNSVAQKMEDNLRRAYGDQKYTVAGDKNCLACHASTFEPATKESVAKWTADSFKTEDGVGCEMCHGHGSLYRDEHQKSVAVKGKAAPGQPSRLVPWREWSPEIKHEWGLINLRDPAVAAHRCASCHVGNKDDGRFVTHEMFAAGHPPLPPLDLLAYTREQPRHWGLAPEMPFLTGLAKKEPDKAWAVFHYRDGESFVARRFAESSVAALDAALGLAGQLGAHAKGAGDGLDFAAFDCYACHHDLKYPSDRQARGYDGIPGRPYFRSAPFVLARLVVDHAAGMKDGGDLKGQADALDALQKKLAGAFATKTYGDPAVVAAVAREAADWSTATRAKLRAVRYTREETARLLARVVEAAERDPAQSRPGAPPGERAVADPEVAQLYTWAYETLVLDLSGPPKDASQKPPELVTQLSDALKGHVVTRLRPGAAFYYEQPATGGVAAPTLQPVDARLTERMNTFNSFRGDLFRDAFKKVEPGVKSLK